MRRNLPLIAATVLAVLSLGALALAFHFRAHDQARIDELARSTNTALCALKADLERRVSATRTFIETHPDGVAGISRAELERSLEGQVSTLHALRPLECP